ncbi:hypothetical protein ACP4OV_011807 [Aristida adscensionis]
MGSTSAAAPATADDCVPPKKRICPTSEQPAQNCDRISALPDDILIKILSLMTIREAGMTDCLSTRWRHLWENVDCLILNKHAFGMQVPENSNNDENSNIWNSEAIKFVNKVNGVLMHHSGSGIKRFEVDFPLSSANALELDRWVTFAAASGSKGLCLYLCDHRSMVASQHVEPYNFPLDHFVDLRGCRFQYLYLTMCSLEAAPANLSGFSCLNFLALQLVSVADSVLLNIMSCCRALRRLALTRCHQLTNVRTFHAKLVELEVYDCKSLIGISIHAEKLKRFSYKGHKIDVQYEYAPVLLKLRALFVKNNECPFDLMGALPTLRSLILQFPSRLRLSRVLQHSGRFVGLKQIVLCLLTSYKKSARAVAYLLKAAPKVQTLGLKVYGDLQLQPLSELKIRWPKKCSLKRLHTISMEGFSGEPELLELVLFILRRSPVLKQLLISPHPSHYHAYGKWKRDESEDDARCCHAKWVALTHLAPKVPSTVKFTII